MPHSFENDRVVFFRSEVVPQFMTLSCFDKKVLRGKIDRVQRACYNTLALYDFDTLEAHIKHALGDPRETVHILEKYFKFDKEGAKFFQTYRSADGAYLDRPLQDKYITNANVIRALLNYRKDAEKLKKQRGGIDEVLRQQAISFQKTLHTKFKIQHTLPKSLKHFKGTLNNFENKGYSSLISGKVGNDNSRKVLENTMGLLESLFGTDETKPSPTEIERIYSAFLVGKKEIINNESGEVYHPSDFKAISDTTVKEYLTRWESKIATYKLRSGNNQQYMGGFKVPHSLEKPKFAGSLLSIDDRQPPFKTHEGKRVWFYMGIDLASEAFTCWVHGKSKEGIITEFYRQLVRNYHEWGFNLPDGLEAEMNLNSSFVNTFLREGAMFENVRIEANRARAKQIERYFGALRYGIEKKRVEWVARPFALNESNQPSSREPATLAYDQIIENCLADIETWNNMPHSRHTHLSRWEVFSQTQNPNLKPTNYIGFLPHLGHKTTTSCRVGQIRLQSGDYLLGENGSVCTGEPLIRLMQRVEGKQVDVYWLDDDNRVPFKALVYIGEQLICEAVPKPTYARAVIERTPQCLVNREIMCKYDSTIEGYGKRRKNEIERVTVVDLEEPKAKTFIMPGLAKNRVLPQSGGLMPDPDEINEELPVRSFVRGLKDRF